MTAATEWRAKAACRHEDPELFFPTAASGPGLDAQAATAKAVCARCPVRRECLAEALVRIPCGIAGGLTEDERRGIAKPSPSKPAPARVAERRSWGCALLADGVTPRHVATRCQVSERTAYRWRRAATPGDG